MGYQSMASQLSGNIHSTFNQLAGGLKKKIVLSGFLIWRWTVDPTRKQWQASECIDKQEYHELSLADFGMNLGAAAEDPRPVGRSREEIWNANYAQSDITLGPQYA